MSTKENSGEVAVEKVTENDKPSVDAKCELKGIKRAAEVSTKAFDHPFLTRTRPLFRFFHFGAERMHTV